MPKHILARFSTGAVVLLALAVPFPDSAQAATCGGDLIPAKATFRDLGTDGIRSDGRTYVHCQDGQVSIGKKEGRFRLDTTKFNTNSAKGHITLDRADCLGGPCSGVPLDVTTDVLFQTHTGYECSNPSDVSTCAAVVGTVLNFSKMLGGDVEYTRLNVGWGSAMLLFTNATDVLAGSPTCTGGNPVKEIGRASCRERV